MRIVIDPVLNMESLEWVGDSGSYEYNGPVISCGGPSKEAKANVRAQAAFRDQLIAQQSKMFGAQIDLLNRIKAVTLPILAAGPSQFGFSPEEDAALRTEIINRAAEAEANAVSATELRERQKAGGANILPTGGEAQIEETARVLGEQSKARQLSSEKLAGYEVGRQLYGQALGALSGNVGSLQDPVRFSGAATGGGQAATGAIQLADSERSHLLGALAGGAIAGGLSLIPGGAGVAAGSAFGNILGGRQQSGG